MMRCNDLLTTKNRTKRIAIIIIVLVTLGSLASNAVAHSSGDIVVSNAWINEAPPNAKVLAAYMVIQNHTAKNDALVSIKSAAFAKVETHQSKEEDGMARMIKLPKIDIPAKGKAVLAPGGMHLMLMNPKKRLKKGDQVEFTLQFESGKKLVVNAVVKKSIGSTAGHHGDHGQMKHHTKPHDDGHKH